MSIDYFILTMGILVLILAFIKRPSKLFKLLTSAIKDNEGQIVANVYNSLPKQVRDRVDSKLVAEIIESVIDILVEEIYKK